jgi:hypothetical protein
MMQIDKRDERKGSDDGVHVSSLFSVQQENLMQALVDLLYVCEFTLRKHLNCAVSIYIYIDYVGLVRCYKGT